MRSRNSHQDQISFCNLLRELAVFLTEKESGTTEAVRSTKLEVSSLAECLLRDAAAMLSAARPPNSFVVSSGEGPPTFDGAVANATPPPLGGAPNTGGGAGTILHLACAMDVPLALAFLLAMGADARTSHTAFRRLMLHEAACNGSIQCLTLLLELGAKLGDCDGNAGPVGKLAPRTRNRRSPTSVADNDVHLPFLPRRLNRSQAMAPLQMYSTRPEVFAQCYEENVSATEPKPNFMNMLRVFRTLSDQVKGGTISELDAARQILEHAALPDASRLSLARSCQLSRAAYARRGGIADGHGNTPLHWAAFKNETACVSLLLQYNADPNARAHPSGWTPLHDAAYSNATETIGLLVDAGALVDARANSGATPLCFAAQEDASRAAEILLERGANLTTRCAGGPEGTSGSRFSGYTPLHYCAHYNAHEAAKVLLRHVTSMKATEIPDLSERLPIHVAVARGSSDVLRELLHAGVRVETRLRNPTKRSTQQSPARREPPRPETPAATPVTPPRPGVEEHQLENEGGSATVSSPVLRSMIPSAPISSSKPWNCLTQRSIDECRQLIAASEGPWCPSRHSLFTPSDREAVMELLRVGKRLELTGKGIYVKDVWPVVLSFCGRGWFEVERTESESESETTQEDIENMDTDSAEEGCDDGMSDDGLTLPVF